MKKFDKEYSTQWMKEVIWLRNNNIPFTFVKTDDNGVTTYKYEKTPELFNKLALFYCQNRSDKNNVEDKRRTNTKNN